MKLEIDTYKQELKDSKLNESLREENEALKNEINKVKKLNASLINDNDKMKKLNEALKKENDKVKKLKETLEKRNDELTSQNDILIHENAELNKKKNILEEKTKIFSKDEIQLIAIERSNSIKKKIVNGKTTCATFSDLLTSIPINYYFKCEKLTEIQIPNSVTHIGNCAFKNCTNLMKLGINNSVIEIGEEVFANCQALKRIILPYRLRKVPKKSFLCLRVSGKCRFWTFCGINR